ncbi:Uncharacterised protein [Starkeya nomas]|uniref:Uncharacterized protein n=2 Tax=Xanthobacteraceae TaxID=335928 RepID=A0A5S9PM63_9HYPH|nr:MULTISPECIES: hypothetical protein [Xanthobacteraceae]TSJ63791.1 hypothetical protein FO470_00320 [Ancylobacter moscoviensis]CAA0105458.1 Uncharacterised protein [Starkeya nomas]
MTPDHEPVRLQYWPPSHAVDAPDGWPDSYEFGTVEDAVAFAMTQSPANRELAWLRTADGQILKPPQIRRLWELRQPD